MSFQTSVRYDMTYGVPGEIRKDGPVRSKPGLLNSVSAAYNIIGETAFTQPAAGGTVAAGGATDPFYGILAKPKNYASFGTSADGPLAPTLTLANNVEAEFISMGFLCISVPAACSIGDLVEFDTTTGALDTITPATKFSGSIAITTGILTITAIDHGYIGTDVPITATGAPAGTVVTGQITGTPGSTGTYNTNIVTAVSAFTDGSTPNRPASGKRLVPNAVIDDTPQTGAGLALVRLTN